MVGLGRIGGEITTRARAFGMKVLAYDPYVSEERFLALGAGRIATLGSLCDVADIVTVHTPLTDETHGLVGAVELARLRPGSIVANLARGGIVDDEALRAALERGHPRGAARDVITLGGTVAAEHGIGKVKAKWLPLQFSGTQQRMLRAIKREFDPAGLLAPGNLL
ncbi:MAG: hypothetical protein EXR94_09530 [Gemmatimonadetes bacterium]|nr:hypothetical protein [Gemmatimonadota bacterium]